MAIWVFEGKQGQGKTTVGAAVMWDAYCEGRDIVTNISVNFPPLTPEQLKTAGRQPTVGVYLNDFMDFLKRVMNGEEKLENTLLYADEIQRYFPARRSSSKENVGGTYLVYETRKRGVDFYASAHRLGMVDVYFRQEVSVRGACRYYAEKPCRKCRKASPLCTTCDWNRACFGCPGSTVKPTYVDKGCDHCFGYGEAGKIVVHWLDIDGVINRNRRRKGLRYITEFDAQKYWSLFDTHERVSVAKKLVDFETAEVR